ncbi:hypothetical protein [Larkinella knui]
MSYRSQNLSARAAPSQINAAAGAVPISVSSMISFDIFNTYD